MNEQQNVNNSTPPKPKKKRSFWWLKLLLILILFAAGIIAGVLLTSQPIMTELRDEILDEFFPRYAVHEPVTTPMLTTAPTEKPIEYKASPTPAPKPSKAPVEIISPEQQEKTESVESEAAPEVAANSNPLEITEPLPTAKPEGAPGVEGSREYIGIDAALNAALVHAGYASEEVFVYSVSRERDDGLVYYDIEFGYEDKEYEYEVNAFTGVVESWKTVRADRGDLAVAAASTETLDVASYVSADLAKAAAFEHAGYREHEVRDLKTSLEIENNKLIYDIEFNTDGFEFDYKVDAQSGLVIMLEKERS